MANIMRKSACIPIMLVGVGVLIHGQQSRSASDLVVGTAKPLEIPRGQARTLKLAMAVGDVAWIDFDAQDLGLILSVRDPTGAELVRAEGLIGSYGPQAIGILATVAGQYALKIEPVDDAAGPCALTLREQRPATAEDRRRISVQGSLLKAIPLIRQATPDTLRSATQELESAREASRTSNDAHGEALALSWLGRIQMTQAQPKAAAQSFESAMGLWNKNGNRRAEAQAMNYVAEAQIYLGPPQKALDLYQRALEIRRQFADRRGEADTLNGIGMARIFSAENARAIESLQQALRIRQALGDRTGQAITLNNIGTAQTQVGENRAGVESLERALALMKASPNPRLEAQMLSNLGRTYGLLSEYQKAMDYSLRALRAVRALADRRSEGIVLNNLGALYQALGESQRAVEYYTQSLSIKRSLGDRRGEATTLNNIGWVMLSVRRYRPALEQFQAALPLIRTAGDRQVEADVLNNIGDSYRGLLEFDTAFEYYRPAIALRTASGNRQGEAYALNSEAAAYLQMKRYPEALTHYEKGLALCRETGDANGELGALFGLARASAALGDLEKAYRHAQSGLRIIESSRAHLVHPNLRTSYFAAQQEYYEFAVDLLMRLHSQDPTSGYSITALEVHERAHARSLVEMLSESGTNVRSGVPRDLSDREQMLREQLTVNMDRRMRGLLTKDAGQSAATLAKEIDRLSDEYEQVESEIRSTSPAYASITRPVPLTAPKMQSEFQDDRTALLEYALGTDRSYGWLITRSSIQVFVLPARSDVEKLARRFYDLLSSRNGSSGIRDRDGDVEQLAESLGSMLLGPVANVVRGKRLVIVPDGVLCYIPFDALGQPGAPAGRYTALAATNIISYLPSASVLPIIRMQGARRATPPKMVSVIADPVFDRSDPRVRPAEAGGSGPKPSGADLSDHPESRAISTAALSRLVFSRREALSIYSLFPSRLAKISLDFSANLGAMTAPEMAEYRIIHLATHGFLDSEHPDRSALVLSLVDRNGKAQQGFLKVGDIFNLNLPADLVVLSACQTALGSDIRGEGLVGLTRAFMYAGATRVVASLWKVDDLATAELMTAFYRRLAAGKNPAAALQEAKLAIILKPAWASPYYWAGFELQGEFEGSVAAAIRR